MRKTVLSIEERKSNGNIEKYRYWIDDIIISNNIITLKNKVHGSAKHQIKDRLAVEDSFLYVTNNDGTDETLFHCSLSNITIGKYIIVSLTVDKQELHNLK